jgi:uncharacterized protein YbaR (Trm112 family)
VKVNTLKLPSSLNLKKLGEGGCYRRRKGKLYNNRNMNKKTKIKLLICPKCNGRLKIENVKNKNTMYLIYLKCKCGYQMMGSRVPNNIRNPFYFSRKSFKFLNNLNYKNYLKSNHWKILKRKYLKKCFVCGEKAELHHRTYRNIGKEKARDLISLCRKHHYYTHFIYNQA